MNEFERTSILQNVQKATVVSEDMKKINRYTRRTLKSNEVYCFNVVLCDNEIDRDCECFTNDSLNKLADLFVGKTGIFDHDPKGENQTARIYSTQAITDQYKKTEYGAPYTYLLAKAYTVRSEKNADLILEIDAGIKKEVSVGCRVNDITCSICGTNLRKSRCGHEQGKQYAGEMCHAKLENPTDAYEWSFVAVPAQKNAGVVKRFSANVENNKNNEGITRNTKGEKQVNNVLEELFKKYLKPGKPKEDSQTKAVQTEKENETDELETLALKVKGIVKENGELSKLALTLNEQLEEEQQKNKRLSEQLEEKQEREEKSVSDILEKLKAAVKDTTVKNDDYQEKAKQAQQETAPILTDGYGEV